MSEDLERSLDLSTLSSFQFTRVLSESTTTGSIYLLGTIHGLDAIVHLQRTVLESRDAAEIVQSGLEGLFVFLENSPYYSAHGLIRRSLPDPDPSPNPTSTSTDPTAPTSLIDYTDPSLAAYAEPSGPKIRPDLVIKVIWPATPTHIRKYTAQEIIMITETPEIYNKVVVPYIDSFPVERIEWVYNILDGKKEADKVLFRDTHPENGFLITPDLKWDQTSMKALYLTALVYTREIRCLRDLRKSHVPLLKRIQRQAGQTAQEHFGVEANKLRLFVHYQPSYYHFHVHIVHIEHQGLAGMTAGQAHLLNDLITLLDLSPPEPAPSLVAQMTLTYALGVEHGLYPGLSAEQTE